MVDPLFCFSDWIDSIFWDDNRSLIFFFSYEIILPLVFLYDTVEICTRIEAPILSSSFVTIFCIVYIETKKWFENDIYNKTNYKR